MALFSGISALVGMLGFTGFTIGPVAGFFLRVAASLALSKLSAALAGKKAGDNQFGVKGQLQRGADLPQSFILGNTATAGSLTYANTWAPSNYTPNTFLTLVISLSDLPIQSLNTIWVNGAACTLGETADTEFDRGYPVTEFAEAGYDFMWVKFYDGTQTTSDDFIVDNVGSEERPWDANAIGTGVAYAVITCRINPRLFNGFPQFLFDVTGIPLYDPSKDTTVGGDGAHRWADPATWGGDGDYLPAVQEYNLLRGLTYGGDWFYGLQDVEAAQLPAAAWIVEIEKCRNKIMGQGGPEVLYRAGGEIAVGSEIASAVEALHDACNGRLSEAGGQYKLYVGGAGSPVATFTDGDIISTAEQSFTPFMGLSDMVNGVAGQYPDPAAGWQVQTAPPIFRTDYEAEDGGRRLMVDVTFDLVPYPEQVQRLMQSALREARRARRHTITLPPNYWTLEPGDNVTWTSTRNGYSAKLFRVDGLVDLPNADVVVDLTEIDPTDYDFDTNTDFTPVNPPSISGPIYPVQEFQGFAVYPDTVRDGSAVARRPAIRVEWTGAVDDVDAVQVRVRVAATAERVFSGRFEDVADGAALVSIGLVSDTDYEVQARYIPRSARATSWSGWLPVTTPDVALGVDDLGNDIWDRVDDEAGRAVNDLFGNMDFILDRLSEIDLEGRIDGILDVNRVVEEAEATRTQLVADLLADVDTQINATETTLTTQIGAVSANLTQNYVTAANQTAALASLETSLTAETATAISTATQSLVSYADQTTAFATFETSLLAQTDTAIATATQSLVSQTDQTSALAALETSLTTDYQGAISTATQNLVSYSDQTTALAALETSLTTDYQGAISTATQNLVSTSSMNSAISAATTTLDTEINGLSTSVDVVAASVDGIEGTFGVRVNNNGVVSGFGLVSDLVDGTATSSFTVAANQFIISAWDGTAAESPFTVTGGKTYIKSAVIQDATITGAHIEALSVDTLHIAGEAVETGKLADNAATIVRDATGGGGDKQIAVVNDTGTVVDLIIMAFFVASDTAASPEAGCTIYKETTSGGTSNALKEMAIPGGDFTPGTGTVRAGGTLTATTTVANGLTRYIRAVGIGDNVSQLDLIVFQRQK